MSRSRWFLCASILVLIGTSLFWSLLSSRLQNNNADQLIDGYLFESWHTFTHASFPSAHSFLLKWPLFALAAFCNNSTVIITILTVTCALAPVAALAFLLSRIERRPVILGLWFLALSSVLLLVPAQPSPGTLLPVNFAMFTTRNLEYAVFLLVLALLTNVKTWRSISTWAAGILAVLLMASDGIFMPLFIGALGVMLVMRFTLRRRVAVWLGVIVVSYLGAQVILRLLQHYYVTGFSDQGVSPYGLSGGVGSLVQAVAYGIIGIGTILGANPGYAHLVLVGLPQAVQQGLQGPAMVGYIVNVLIAAVLFGLSLYFVATFRHRRGRADLLAMMTLGAAIAAAGVYVLTNHYYPADSRYLAIWLFALVLCSAVVLRTIQLPRKLTIALAALLLIAVPLAILGSWQQYTAGRDALRPRQAFAQSIAKVAASHNITAIAGDYWDVAPVRQAAHNRIAIVPLTDCTTPSTTLSSSAWQKRSSGRVAYLLNARPYQSGFPTCDVVTVTNAFGQPDKTIFIRTPGLPDSQLLLYDYGMKHLLPSKLKRPVPPEPKLAMPSHCEAGRVMQVVAHEDDDLLFMNPDLQRAMTDQQCVLTVYVTAGDAGNGEGYAEGRIAGTQAAYTYIYNGSSEWTTTNQRFQGRTITQATMKDQPRLLLLFLNLPDGNPRGSGFTSSHNASLARLRSGSVQKIQPIEGHGSYTADELTNTLTTIMQSYQPNEVRTQNYNPNTRDGDHSDHHAVGQLAADAFRSYNANAMLKAYAGYPVRELSPNVDGDILAAKEGAFFVYADHDRAACNSVQTCYEVTAYGSYLPRQYSRLVAENSYLAPLTATKPHGSGPSRPVILKPEPQRRTCEIGNTPYVINCPLKPLTNLVY